MALCCCLKIVPRPVVFEGYSVPLVPNLVPVCWSSELRFPTWKSHLLLHLGVFEGFRNNAFGVSHAVYVAACSALALPLLKAAAGINRIQLFVGLCRTVFGERAPSVARTHGSPVPLCPHWEAALLLLPHPGAPELRL